MTDTTKVLGYGGCAIIDGVQVLITSGSLDESGSVSYLEMYDIIPTDASRSRVAHADGTEAFSGTVNLDVSENAMALFSINRLLKRNFNYGGGGFDVEILDGEHKYKMAGCKVSSITLAGAAGGLITASVAFVATSGKGSSTSNASYMMDYSMTPKDRPAAYWWSGNEDVRDWSLTFTQDVQPVYLNEDVTTPRYIRVGLITYSLAVTTYEELSHSTIQVVTDVFTLTGNTTSKNYTFNGPTDLGMYGHTFETAADAAIGSNDVIISS